MLAGLDKIRDTGMSIAKAKSLGQFSLFIEDETPDTQDHLPDLPEWDKSQKLAAEKELLGFYLTEHPHAEKLQQPSEFITHKLSELFLDDVKGKIVTIPAIVESCRNVVTKSNNQPMCFAKLSDLSKTIEAVVFPKTYALNPQIWQPDKVVLVTGKIEDRGPTQDIAADDAEVQTELTMIVDSAAEFTGPDTVLPKLPQSNGNGHRYTSPPPPKLEKSSPPTITIYIPRGFSQTKLIKLNELLQNHKGSRPAELVFPNNGSTRTIPLSFGLAWSTELKSSLDALLT